MSARYQQQDIFHYTGDRRQYSGWPVAVAVIILKSRWTTRPLCHALLSDRPITSVLFQLMYSKRFPLSYIYLLVLSARMPTLPPLWQDFFSYCRKGKHEDTRTKKLWATKVSMHHIRNTDECMNILFGSTVDGSFDTQYISCAADECKE